MGLALKRKKGEKFIIGEDIVITVIRIKGKEVSLHVHAPNLVVDREEVRLSKKRDSK